MATLNGIINLDKPVGITSAKALYRVRSITNQRKSGHAGTLDPAAAGVLVLCLGQATRLVESIMDQPKVYRATARLDVTSESYDSDRPLMPVQIAHVPTADEIVAGTRNFEGTIQQTPPAISAVKVGGVPAYKRAARGEAPRLAPRPVTVYWLHVHGYEWPILDIEICCGRGTYVRSLIRDLGARLGTGGCLTSLVRTQVGPFLQSGGWSFERLVEASSPENYMIELEPARKLLLPASVAVPPRPVRRQPPTLDTSTAPRTTR